MTGPCLGMIHADGDALFPLVPPNLRDDFSL